METTLTDRYIGAVVRTVPEDQRDDVGAELRASVADQIDARIEQGEERDAAERAVLTALGDPDKLAAGYTGRQLYLIGPRYYLEWWRLVKLLLWIVVPLGAFGIALGQSLAGVGIGGIFGAAVGGAISVAVHLFFWTALVFALIDRAESAGTANGTLQPWSLDKLPLENPYSGARFVDMIANIVFLLLGAAALVWDQLVGAVYLEGRWISLLSPSLWPWWVCALLVVMAVTAVLSIVVYLNGRWTVPLAAFNAVLNVVVAGPAIWLLSQDRLLNPEFWLTVIPAPDAEKVYTILSVLTGFAIAGIAIWSSVDAFLKARRAR